MALQNAFGHLLPILYDESEPDYIPTPIANSTAIAPDDNAFSNILSDASRVLLDADIPPPAPELSDDEQNDAVFGHCNTAYFITYFESNWLETIVITL